MKKYKIFSVKEGGKRYFEIKEKWLCFWCKVYFEEGEYYYLYKEFRFAKNKLNELRNELETKLS